MNLIHSARKIVAVAGIAIATSLVGYAGTGTAKNVLLTNNDKYQNEIKFVSTAPVEKIEGVAKGISGGFAIDMQNLNATTGKITVAVSSMKTGNSMRDDHMYSDTWLDQKKHPEITFVIKGLKDTKTQGANGRSVITATAMGEFTLHGVTKQIETKITITYLAENAETKKIGQGDFALVQTEFDVPLKDYNVTGKAGIVGSKVGESIAIKAQLFGTTAGSN
jgi:polyisoprenoid-binding protein YceI